MFTELLFVVLKLFLIVLLLVFTFSAILEGVCEVIILKIIKHRKNNVPPSSDIKVKFIKITP